MFHSKHKNNTKVKKNIAIFIIINSIIILTFGFFLFLHPQKGQYTDFLGIAVLQLSHILFMIDESYEYTVSNVVFNLYPQLVQ